MDSISNCKSVKVLLKFEIHLLEGMGKENFNWTMSTSTIDGTIRYYHFKIAKTFPGKTEK